MLKNAGGATEDFHSALADYFRVATTANESQLAWRMKCFERGQLYAKILEQRGVTIAGKHVLDIAAGWGAHALAFAQRGASVVASDLYDSKFSELERFSSDHNLSVKTCVADCVSVPQPAANFDIVICLELIEHISDPRMLASEIDRLLKPGGVCFLTTPAKLRSVLTREPHYHLPLIAALPFPLQHLVATKIFGRTYPFPITRQYWNAGQIEKEFEGFGVRPILYWSAEKLATKFSLLRPILERYFWKAFLIKKENN